MSLKLLHKEYEHMSLAYRRALGTPPDHQSLIRDIAIRGVEVKRKAEGTYGDPD